MESSLTEITVKTCDCYSAYIDGVVKLTIDDIKKFKFVDFETSCYRLFSNIMVKCCFNCLKEKFLKMNITLALVKIRFGLKLQETEKKLKWHIVVV